MSAEPLYRLRDLTKTYGPAPALEIASLDILTGEVLGLLGPTGAGKSTLLRLLAGLESASGGTVALEGHPLRAEDMPLPLRRRIALVPQRPVLLTASVAANIEYGLRIRHVRDRRSRVADVLTRLGLARHAARSAPTLSGGETQLVGLARALVVRPDVLLLDEPTANLDPGRVALVEEVIRDARRERGLTVVWATHNLFQARRVADRVALLLEGRLVEVAPAPTFFAAPADPRAADFVQGKMVY